MGCPQNAGAHVKGSNVAGGQRLASHRRNPVKRSRLNDLGFNAWAVHPACRRQFPRRG
jgi:hypothetical protein